MFETSAANLRLFDLEPIVTFAERLVAADCHVMHNNSFRTPTGGGISGWHQDDAPHFEVTNGEPPDNVHLPVLLFTCNYYLTDVDTVEHGPTQTVPRSHLVGARPPNPLEGSGYEDRVVSKRRPGGQRDHVQQPGLAPGRPEHQRPHALHHPDQLCPAP